MKWVLANVAPTINSYTKYGALFSMAEENIWPWAFNNLIQIRYNTGWGILTFDLHECLFEYCPCIENNILSRSLIHTLSNEDIVHLLMKWLDEKYYIFLFVNKNIFLKVASEVYMHEIFIYGYDSEKRIFLAADNLENGTFQTFNVSYEDFIQAYKTSLNNFSVFNDIQLLKYNAEAFSEININQMKLKIKYYLNSIETPDFLVRREQTFLYGIKTYEVLYRCLQECMYTESIDIRAFHFMYEHKKMMRMRVHYLFNAGIIDEKKLSSNFEKLEHDILILRNKAIRIAVLAAGKKERAIKQAQEDLEKIVKTEKELLNQLYDSF